MNLKQTRLVTDDVKKLTAFYERLTGASARVITAAYVEFQESPCAGLAIANAAAVAEAYGADVVAPRVNQSVVLDFEVEDVDALYGRLKHSIGEWVQPPTTQPWGNRSVLLRDPDGNLINLFASRGTPARATART